MGDSIKHFRRQQKERVSLKLKFFISHITITIGFGVGNSILQHFKIYSSILCCYTQR